MVVRAHAGGLDEILLIVLPIIAFRVFYLLGRGRLPRKPAHQR